MQRWNWQDRNHDWTLPHDHQPVGTEEPRNLGPNDLSILTDQTAERATIPLGADARAIQVHICVPRALAQKDQVLNIKTSKGKLVRNSGK